MASRLARLPLAVLVAALLIPVALPPGAADDSPTRAGRPLAPTHGVWIEEAVTDPQTDRDASGSVTSPDEYVVLYNAGSTSVTLTGWTLLMEDSTPETQALEGGLAAKQRMRILNPAGQMNNDVRLVLKDAWDAVVDDVTLGSDGIADGNAADLFDEAVHLAGPWAATKAPASEGQGLGAVWLESIAREGQAQPETFADVWVASDNVSLRIRALAAPDTDTTNVTLHVGSVAVAINTTSQPWQTGPFVPPAGDAVPIRIIADDWTLETFPGRGAANLRIDHAPPTVGSPTDVVVQNATGHLRWIPPATDAESGIDSLTVTATNETQSWNLTGCTPHDDPAPTCRVTTSNATVRITATDRAGRTTNATFPLVNDTTPPTAVTNITFEQGVPPRFLWQSPPDPLKIIRIEIADDVTGAWPRANHTLAANATAFTDFDWTPGDPRAYRVVVRDRADLENASTWRALPPDAVPVQVTAALEGVAKTLVTSGSAAASLQFDRPLVHAPALVLQGADPPFLLDAQGTLAPDARSAEYVLNSPGLPRSGSGEWRLAGGEGIDGAPTAAFTAATTWDAEPPTLTMRGASDGWIRAERHVVTVEAHDATDEKPRVDVTVKPKGVTVSGPREARTVKFSAQGLHEVQGEARDQDGNTRAFTLRVALDGKPPTVKESGTRPKTWAAESPLRLTIDDPVSGVNRTSLRVWVRNATSVAADPLLSWDNKTVTVRPTNGTMNGPVELHVAVADEAGNVAEGPVGRRLATTSGAAPADASPASAGPTAKPRPASAPDAKGPEWRPVPPPSTANGGSGQSGGSSLWDPAAWEAASAERRSTSDEGSGAAYAVAGAGAGALALVGAVAFRRAKRKGGASTRRTRSHAPARTGTSAPRSSRSPIDHSRSR